MIQTYFAKQTDKYGINLTRTATYFKGRVREVYGFSELNEAVLGLHLYFYIGTLVIISEVFMLMCGIFMQNMIEALFAHNIIQSIFAKK